MHSTRLLISTKFAPPRISAQHVPRTGLLSLLGRTQQRKLALVTGSAGYGKTTLLAQWRQACLQAQADVAWLSLTSDDKGFADFCAVFLAALQQVGVPVELDLYAGGVSEASIDEIVTSVLAGLGSLVNDLFLILDDYHHVEDPWIHKLVQKLLDQCPANLHLVIASRSAPLLSLSRIRVMDQIVEIDCEQLPFCATETRSFLEANLGPGKINHDDASLIHEMTGGWPSCVQLIVIMLKNRPGAGTRLRDLVWRSNDLQTYLSEEVLSDLPADLVELAETLSLFRRFNAPLAESVTGNPRAAELIRRMELENLPIQPVDLEERAPWFRFHWLFGELLNTRVERRGARAVAQLHGRASRWFAASDLLVEAVRHANLAGDVEFAASVIEGAVPANWTFGYLGPTLGLLERLSPQTLFRHRKLSFLACLAVALSARAPVALARLAQLRASEAGQHPDIARRLPLVDAVIALQQDDAQRTIDLLESQPDTAIDNTFLRYLALSALATAYAGAGRYADARSLLDRHPMPPLDQNSDMAIVAENTRVLLLVLEGKASEAERLAVPLLSRAQKGFGSRSVPANVCSAFVADVFYELDRIDDARETLANRQGLLESASVEVTVRASLCRARLDLLQESPDVALAFLNRQATRFRTAGLDRPRALMHAEQIRIQLGRSDPAQAGPAMAALDELARAHAGSSGFSAEIPAAAAIARARLNLGRQPELAAQALEEARGLALALGRGTLLTLVDLLSARALDELGRTGEAMACRTRAVEAGCRLGLVRTFLDEGALARGEFELLVPNLAPKDPLMQYACALLERFPDDRTARGLALPAQKRSRGRREQTALTQREIDVLALVAQAMSNKRIALTLNITVETVKWNLRNVFAKLDVSSRYDAMVWARNRNLIR
ncbi:LuxR C-terminal-related transcriptional regulator [Paraburkholderia sp. GAS334]|uniref:helix-turn-helix transcriptional regulator n=1 Tax=Paraburkholderia sp. GAS334 TaxID=3035131 RepID=UPI003D258A78